MSIFKHLVYFAFIGVVTNFTAFDVFAASLSDCANYDLKDKSSYNQLLDMIQELTHIKSVAKLKNQVGKLNRFSSCNFKGSYLTPVDHLNGFFPLVYRILELDAEVGQFALCLAVDHASFPFYHSDYVFGSSSRASIPLRTLGCARTSFGGPGFRGIGRFSTYFLNRISSLKDFNEPNQWAKNFLHIENMFETALANKLEELHVPLSLNEVRRPKKDRSRINQWWYGNRPEGPTKFYDMEMVVTATSEQEQTCEEILPDDPESLLFEDFEQGKSNLCYAFAATRILEKEYSLKLEPYSLGLFHEIADNFNLSNNRYVKEFGYGYVNGALWIFDKYGVCEDSSFDEKELFSKLDESLTLSEWIEYSRKHLSKNSYNELVNLSQGLEAYSIKSHSTKFLLISYLIRSNCNVIKKKFNFDKINYFPSNNDESNSLQVIQFVMSSLYAGKWIATSFQSHLMNPGSTGSHSNVIVGQKFNPYTKSCEWIVSDSSFYNDKKVPAYSNLSETGQNPVKAYKLKGDTTGRVIYIKRENFLRNLNYLLTL